MNSSKFKGTLKTWKDDRGFGFIKPDHDEHDVFIHISAFHTNSRRPWKGDVIFYDLEEDKGGKYRAVNASIEGVTLKPKRSETRNGKSLIILGILVIGVLALLAARYFQLI